MKASQNRTDEKGLQTAFDSAKKRIPKFWKHKTMVFITAFERSWRKKHAYNSKTFDKKKTPIAFTTKSTNGKIVKSKIYHKTIIDFDKKKWMAAICEKLIALISKNIWVRKKLSKDKNLIISKWIFKMKYKQNGIVKRFKIQLITKNFI